MALGSSLFEEDQKTPYDHQHDADEPLRCEGLLHVEKGNNGDKQGMQHDDGVGVTGIGGFQQGNEVAPICYEVGDADQQQNAPLMRFQRVPIGVQFAVGRVDQAEQSDYHEIKQENHVDIDTRPICGDQKQVSNCEKYRRQQGNRKPIFHYTILSAFGHQRLEWVQCRGCSCSVVPVESNRVETSHRCMRGPESHLCIQVSKLQNGCCSCLFPKKHEQQPIRRTVSYLWPTHGSSRYCWLVAMYCNCDI